MANGKAELRLQEASTPPVANPRGAIVGWVTEPDQLEPIHSVGGWLK